MKEVRLTKRAEFVSLTKNRKAIFMPHFTLQYLLKPGQLSPRFGYTASKKVGNAVVRNRVKRRLREVVRLYIKKTADVLLSYDFVLIGRTSSCDASFSDLESQFKDALDKIRALHLSPNPLISEVVSLC